MIYILNSAIRLKKVWRLSIHIKRDIYSISLSFFRSVEIKMAFNTIIVTLSVILLCQVYVEATECPTMCPQHFNPVCGTRRQKDGGAIQCTFSNACHLSVRRCVSRECKYIIIDTWYLWCITRCICLWHFFSLGWCTWKLHGKLTWMHEYSRIRLITPYGGHIGERTYDNIN